MTDRTTTLLEVGNTSMGVLQAATDIQSPQTGVDKFAQLMNLSSTVITLAKALLPTTEFGTAFFGTLGGTAGFLGAEANGMQFTAAYSRYVQAMNDNDAAAQSAALRELGDKAAGFVASVGAAMVVFPRTSKVGLGMWLGASAAQQIMNGNAEKLVNFLTDEAKSAIVSMTGGPQLQVNQYQVGSGEAISVKFVDQYGLDRGSYAVVSGQARAVIPQTTTQVQSDIIVLPTVYVHGNEMPPDPHFDLSLYPKQTYTVPVSTAAFNNSLVFANNAAASGFNGNTVDFADAIIQATGYSTFSLKSMLNPNSQSYWYMEELSYVLKSPWQVLVNDESTTGQYLTDLEYYLPSKLGRSKYQEQMQNVYDAYFDAGYSPIMLDLDGNTVQTTDIRSGAARFDLNGDGLQDTTAWADPNDAFLALDRNGDGSINDIGELFGGGQRGRGFAKLALMDTNADGVIDNRDEDFDKLMLWQDRNGDGRTDAGELASLGERGVQSLSLDYVSQETRQNGNLIGEVAHAMVNGETRELADVYFRYSKGEQTVMSDAPVNANDLWLQAEAAMREHLVALGPALGQDRSTVPIATNTLLNPADALLAGNDTERKASLLAQAA